MWVARGNCAIVFAISTSRLVFCFDFCWWISAFIARYRVTFSNPMFSRFLSEDYPCSCYINRLRHVRSDAKDHTSGDPKQEQSGWKALRQWRTPNAEHLCCGQARKPLRGRGRGRLTLQQWRLKPGAQKLTGLRPKATFQLSTGSGQQKQRAGEDVPAPAVLLAGAWRLVHGGCDRCDYGEFLQKIIVQSPSISQLSHFAEICSKTLIASTSHPTVDPATKDRKRTPC